MWKKKYDIIDPFRLALNVFGIEGTWIYHQCLRCHCFVSFIATFPSTKLLYTSSASILVLNCINYKAEEKTEVYAFTLSMYSERLSAENISVFEDFNIIQIGINQTDTYWSN